VSTTIDELLVAVKIDLRNNKAVLLSLKEVEKQFFGVTKAAEKTDKAVSKVGTNNGLKKQASNALQMLSQVNHTNNGLHAMHTILTKIGSTGPLIAGIAAAFAAMGAYKLSEQVAGLEKLRVQQDFLFSDTPTGGAGMRERAGVEGLKFGMSINDLTDAITSFKLQSIDINEKFLPAMMAGAESQGRTLKSVALMVDDALSGQGRRLKEYGITQKTGPEGYTFRKHGMETQTFGKEDRAGIIDYLGRAFEQQYGGLARATSETISADMQRVQNALTEDTTSVWKTFAKGATDPIFESWNGIAEKLTAWTKDPAVQEGIKNIGRGVGEGILLVARLVEFIGMAIGKLTPLFDFIMTTLGVIFDIFETGLDFLTRMLNNGFADAVKAWDTWGEVIWLGFELIALKFTNAVLDLIEQFVPGMDNARAMLTEFFIWLDEKWVAASLWVSNFMDSLESAILRVELIIIEGIEDAFTTAIDWLKDKASFFSSTAAIPEMTGGRGGGVVNNTNVQASYNINAPSVESGMMSSRVNTSYLYG